MTKYVLIALVAVAALAGVAYVAHDRLFGDPAPSAPAAPEQPPPLPPPAAEEELPLRALVTQARGRLERKGADGRWIEIKTGDVLSAHDTVRTGDDGVSTLDFGGDVVVEVGERSEVTVMEISLSLSRVLVGEGRISAASAGRKGSRVRVETRGTGAIAETAGGRFTVLSSGAGDVTVATSEGSVDLTSAGATVRLGPGEQSRARPNLPPSTPVAIPASLFLKVRQPQVAARTREAGIRGETTPGAVVSINGVRSSTDESGRFASVVPLTHGDNVIVVEVEDAAGRREVRRLSRISIDTTGPDVKGEVTW